MATVVARGFVKEARSKIVLVRMGLLVGTSEREPKCVLVETISFSSTDEQDGSRKHPLNHGFFEGRFDRLEIHGFISKLRPKKIPES